MNKKGMLSVTAIFATLGAILISIGIIWFLASNWHQIPSVFKIIILLLAIALSYVAAYKVELEHPIIGQVLYVLTSILWTLSIFLIAQIFNLPTTLQANANILLVAAIGTILFSYIIDSEPVLVVAIFSFWTWVMLQTLASAMVMDQTGSRLMFPFIVLNQLAVTGALFGFALIHRAYKKNFARVFTWWAAFSMFATGLWLSNQITQYYISDFWKLPGTMIAIRLGLPILLVAIGVFVSLLKPGPYQFGGWGGTLLWLCYVIAVIALSPIIGMGRNENYQGSLWTMSTPYILQWIFFNILFIALTLLVITFATKEKRGALVHLALWAFIIYIAARYIGFIMDLSGYLAMSTLFIVGGIGLIVLALLLNKFRRHTIQKLT